MPRTLVLLALAVTAALGSTALAQQPVRPLPRLGSCPIGTTAPVAIAYPPALATAVAPLKKQATAVRLVFIALVTTASAVHKTNGRQSRKLEIPARSAGLAPAITALKAVDAGRRPTGGPTGRPPAELPH